MDFLAEIAIAAKNHGFKEDLLKWCEAWLKNAGVNTFRHEMDVENGKIKQLRIF